MIQVLDHGYVKLVDHWGTDEDVIEAARMSTGRGFEGWEKDAKLLKFLYSHKHHTPFEMCGLVLEIKAPIFVFREWHRHRTQSYNEMSARYIPLPDENYIPNFSNMKDRAILGATSSNRQASGTGIIPSDQAMEAWLSQLQTSYEFAQNAYEAGIALGIPKEIARLPVPVARYSRMRASANLRNWLHFLELRLAPNAQWEIRQYAEAVANFVGEYFPRTWELYQAEHNAGK